MNKKFLLSIGLILLLVSACKKDDNTEARIGCTITDLEAQPFNDFQVIASHNSYRIKTYAPIYNLLNLAIQILPDGIIPPEANPILEWDYNHVNFEKQFTDYHVRSLEIDVYHDPEGGLYADRYGKVLAGQPVASGEPALDEPGLKVLHIPHLDYMTHYLTWKESLSAILDWSNEHPNHFPISVMIELKDFGDAALISELVLPFTEEAKKGIATELLSIFPEDKIFKPSDLRTEEDLEKSIKENGWPSIAEMRGKVIFIAMGHDEIEETIFGSNSNIVQNGNNIFKIMNDPVSDFDEIKEAIESGFIVRTRADAGTTQARTGDTRDRDVAFESGAQIISTDYYRADPRHINLPHQWTDYKVQFNDGVVARSNKNNVCTVLEAL